MKLGFVSAILSDLSFEETVDFAAAEQFSCVEMMCWPKGKAERRYAGVTHIDVTDMSHKAVDTINTYLQKKNVSVSGLGYYPNPLADDREQAAFFAEHILKVIDASAALGVGVMNTFVGREHTKSVDYNFDRFKEVWPSIVKRAEEKGVKIGIENCPMFFSKEEWPGGKNLAATPAMWRRMFDAIPSPSFGLNYDPSHMVWQRMDYIAPIYEFKERIFHVHLKDAKMLWDKLNQVGIMAAPLEYHAPKLPGLGDVDWSGFFSALTDIRYRGAVVIEAEDRAFEDSLESRKNALRQSRNYLSRFLA